MSESPQQHSRPWGTISQVESSREKEASQVVVIRNRWLSTETKETSVGSPGSKVLEENMATQVSILAWRIPPA